MVDEEERNMVDEKDLMHEEERNNEKDLNDEKDEIGDVFCIHDVKVNNSNSRPECRKCPHYVKR